MNWEMIGSIGEITARIGVILSLIYVGRQLKANQYHGAILVSPETRLVGEPLGHEYCFLAQPCGSAR